MTNHDENQPATESVDILEALAESDRALDALSAAIGSQECGHGVAARKRHNKLIGEFVERLRREVDAGKSVDFKDSSAVFAQLNEAIDAALDALFAHLFADEPNAVFTDAALVIGAHVAGSDDQEWPVYIYPLAQSQAPYATRALLAEAIKALGRESA